MSVAQLSYMTKKDGRTVIFPIDSGTLREIDGITMDFKDEDDLKEYYSDKIMSYTKGIGTEGGSIILTYIRNNEKNNKKILYNQENIIRTRTSSLEDIKSEPEMVRKRLFSSKNKWFLSSYLADEQLAETTDVTIKLTSWELSKIRNLKEKDNDTGIEIKAVDGEYRASVRDIFMYALKNKKLGWARGLFEDALEVFKDNLLLNLTDEDLYYFSREFRFKLNEFDEVKVREEGIKNFIIGNVELLEEECHLMDRDIFKVSLPTRQLKKTLVAA